MSAIPKNINSSPKQSPTPEVAPSDAAVRKKTKQVVERLLTTDLNNTQEVAENLDKFKKVQEAADSLGMGGLLQPPDPKNFCTIQ